MSIAVKSMRINNNNKWNKNKTKLDNFKKISYNLYDNYYYSIGLIYIKYIKFKFIH